MLSLLAILRRFALVMRDGWKDIESRGLTTVLTFRIFGSDNPVTAADLVC